MESTGSRGNPGGVDASSPADAQSPACPTASTDAHQTNVLVPEKLTVDSVTATSAVVSWSLSHGMEQTPHSFLISYQTEGTEPESISTEAQSTVITGLKPYTEYTVCVSTQLQHGLKSQPASTTVHTALPPPGPIQFSSVKPDFVDLNTADMTSISESTKVPVVSTSSPHNTNTGGASSTCTGCVVCIVCEKTVKSCLTCTESYCDTHIEQHYTVPILHEHKLVEATGEVEQNICQPHFKDLEIFCKTDQITICTVCLAKDHDGHDIIHNKTNQTSSQNPEKMDPECSIIKGNEQLASTRSYNRSPEIEPFPIRKLIEQCQTITTGIPACYLLPTEKSEVDGNSAVRRWTFGKRDECKSTKTVLIVGETGTGKTTLINTMVNFMLGVELEERVWFQITEEDKNKSQAESHTSAITVYELFLEKCSSCLRIIDTPGYGATDGIKFDQQIAENLNVLFRSEDGIHEIEAVGLVVKASQNRLTDFQHYILNAIRSMFGKDIERNIVVFITHSDGLPAANLINTLNEAEVPCAKDTRGKPLHFMFNNRQHETYEVDVEVLYQGYWNMGYKSVERFLSNLEDFHRIELKSDLRAGFASRIFAACSSIQYYFRAGLGRLLAACSSIRYYFRAGLGRLLGVYIAIRSFFSARPPSPDPEESRPPPHKEKPKQQ